MSDVNKKDHQSVSPDKSLSNDDLDKNSSNKNGLNPTSETSSADDNSRRAFLKKSSAALVVLGAASQVSGQEAESQATDENPLYQPESVWKDRMKPPEDGSFDTYDPANVAPLIAWLVSEQSGHVTGKCFELYGGKLSIADGWRTGEVNDKGERWGANEIGSAIDTLIANAPAAQAVYGS